MSIIRFPFFAAVISTFLPGIASAHEFWIDPLDKVYLAGDDLHAEIRVGEHMRGSPQAYNAARIRQMGVVSAGEPQPLTGRLGDRPAIRIEGAKEGLNILVVETNALTISYANLEKFADFVSAHGQDFAIAAHKEAGLPDADFREGYFRFAKALVPVGDGAGADQSVRFPWELVVIDNPFTGSGEIAVQLLSGGEPVSGHQVDLFQRPIGETGDARLTKLVTDSNGVVMVPREPGDVLLNAVKLQRPNERIADALDVVWLSLWASTTFTLE